MADPIDIDTLRLDDAQRASLEADIVKQNLPVRFMSPVEQRIAQRRWARTYAAALQIVWYAMRGRGVDMQFIDEQTAKDAYAMAKRMLKVIEGR